MKLFSKSKEDRDVDALIDEQRNRESIEVYRRGWCISQAVCMDETRPENLITTAERIYNYVYKPKE